jgi:uncharacterized membrane protein YcaP (DUF421 family)
LPSFDNLIKGHRNKLISEGQVAEHILKVHCVTREDLDEQLRLKRVDDPVKVKAAYLERSGEVSVIPRE